MTTPGTNPSPEIVTTWPVIIGVDYDQAALMCNGWIDMRKLWSKRPGEIHRCRANLSGDTLAEITADLTAHIRNVRHVPPPEPWLSQWDGRGIYNPENGE